MVFSSTVFLFLFLPFTIIGYYNPWFKGRKFRNYFLLFMSMVFYAYGEPLFVGIMILEIVIGWLLGKKIELMQQQKNKKRWLYIGVLYRPPKVRPKNLIFGGRFSFGKI